MQLLRTDTDFGAKTKFKAIGEARRRIDIDGRRIDSRLESGSCRLIFRNDGFGMMGTEAADVVQCFLEGADDLDRHDEGIVFRRPVFLAGRLHGTRLAGFVVTAQFDAVRFHDWGQLLEEGIGHIAVDQERFHGVARRRPRNFGVFDDVDGHVQVGVFIDVDVADAAARFDAGYCRRIDDHADQADSAAGNGQVDVPAQGQQFLDQSPVRIFDEVHGIGRETGFGQAFADDVSQGRIGRDGFAAAAEDAGVAGFDAEDGCVDGDVGPRFINDGDDP